MTQDTQSNPVTAEQIPPSVFCVKCTKCNHVWIAAHLPMEVGGFCEVVKRICCPNCAASGNAIVTAREAELSAGGRT